MQLLTGAGVSKPDFLTYRAWGGAFPGCPPPWCTPPLPGLPRREGLLSLSLSVIISFNLKIEEIRLKLSTYFNVSHTW